MNIFTQFFQNVSQFFKSIFEEKKVEDTKAKEIITHQVNQSLNDENANSRFSSLFDEHVKTTAAQKVNDENQNKEKRELFEKKKAEILSREMKSLTDPKSAMINFLENGKLITKMEGTGQIQYTMNIEGGQQLSSYTDKQKQWHINWQKLAKGEDRFYGDCNSMTSFVSQEMYRHLRKSEKNLSQRDVVLSGSSVDQYETLVKRNQKYGQPILEKGELTADKLKEGMVIFNSVKADRVNGRKHNIGHVAIVMEINDKLKVVEFANGNNHIEISDPADYLHKKSRANYIAAMHVAPKLVQQHEMNLQAEVAKLEKRMFNLDEVKINGAEVKTATTSNEFQVQFIAQKATTEEHADKIKYISAKNLSM